MKDMEQISELLASGKPLMFIGVLLGVTIAVVLAIMLDLWDGVYTARVRGERIRSHILRITIAKISEYWRFVLIGFLVDCIGMLFSFYILPFLTMAFGSGLIVIETKSMFEHSGRRKGRTSDLPTILTKMVECTQEKDAKKIVEQLTDMINESNKKTETKC